MPPKFRQESVEQSAASASVTYRLPAEPLREAITTYYIVRITGPGLINDQIFPEWPNFRLILSGAWEAGFPDEEIAAVPRAGVTGALERAVWVTGSAGVLVGVGMMPEGWPRLTTRSADTFANHMRPLSDALGPPADDLYARLCAAPDEDDALFAVLDEVFAELLGDAPEAPLVAAVHTALQDPQVSTVSAWAGAVGLSARQLERFSLRYFGLTPKRLLRRQRMLRTLAAMRAAPDGTWTQSLDGAFTDQAHFIREFKYYMGTSPRNYLARTQPIMGEAWKRRKALLGAPVQVLQPPSGPT